jgi:hypothetical protein
MSTERDFTTADLAGAADETATSAAAGEQTDTRPQPDQGVGSLQGDGGGSAVGGTSAPIEAGYDSPAGSAAAATASGTDQASVPLFPAEEGNRFREQWDGVQGRFVDEPRQAVEQADHLVAELMQRLAAQFSDTRAELERRWDGQQDVSTEDLRVAMTQYRSFFERLLQA